MENFKVGDVVKLKSDGPKMTIEEYPRQSPAGNYDDRALCSWFKDTEVIRDVFKRTSGDGSDDPLLERIRK